MTQLRLSVYIMPVSTYSCLSSDFLDNKIANISESITDVINRELGKL